MIIHWFPLLGCLFFGLIPPRLLLNSECRYLNFDDFWSTVIKPRKSHQRRRRWWKLPLVWIDPIRGYVVALFVSDAFSLVEHPTPLESFNPLFARFAILAVAVWVQTWGRKKQKETLAPCGFLAGLMLGLLPLIVSISAIAIGAAAATALTSFPAGYIVTTLTTASIGYLFLGRSPTLAAYSALIAIPLLISWLLRTKLVIPVRC